MATAVRSVEVPGTSGKSFKPTRLVGALAAGVGFTTDDAFSERINVAGASKVSISVVLSNTAVVGTLTLGVHRMASVATTDDTDSAPRIAVGSPTPVTMTTNNEAKEIEMDIDGEEFVELEITEGSGGSDVAELLFVDVFLTPRS